MDKLIQYIQYEIATAISRFGAKNLVVLASEEEACLRLL